MSPSYCNNDSSFCKLIKNDTDCRVDLIAQKILILRLETSEKSLETIYWTNLQTRNDSRNLYTFFSEQLQTYPTM